MFVCGRVRILTNICSLTMFPAFVPRVFLDPVLSVPAKDSWLPSSTSSGCRGSHKCQLHLYKTSFFVSTHRSVRKRYSMHAGVFSIAWWLRVSPGEEEHFIDSHVRWPLGFCPSSSPWSWSPYSASQELNGLLSHIKLLWSWLQSVTSGGSGYRAPEQSSSFHDLIIFDSWPLISG